MSIFKQFIKNVIHPRQSAMFRFQRIGKTISYIFFLSLIATILLSPEAIKQLISQNHSLSFIFIPIAFIFYYVLISFAFFIGICVLAGIGLFVARILHKRLNYQQIWSLSANAVTWPTLCLSIIECFYSLPNEMFAVFILFCLMMLVLMIYTVPKPKAPSKSSGSPF
ncbi:DUF1189 family protein [Scopulibacillus cellulosilyticus]|uniref:DUF1189 family protein n=1 Tax=Scopulibacillus cellulosilyticus TaxID=2665665 RepID=A0ABW2PVF2_9BACL